MTEKWNHPWSGSDTERLRALWGAVSAMAIARILGRTRNAVIGRAHRAGLKRLRYAHKRKLLPQVKA